MPLRFPRPVMPVIATVIAAVWVVAGNAPAFADQVRSQQWWLSKLDVGQSWQESRGGGVTVAVLSDGVDAAHSDLAGAVTFGPDFTNSGETTSTFVGLQGTAIASLIAGRGHGSGNSSGVVGVAPRAHILSVRVTLDPNDPAMDHAAVGAGLPDAIANGIRYAVAHHAKVIDLPVDPGEPNPIQVAALPIPPKQTMAPELTGITAAAGGSSAEKAAIAYAVHKGVVLVAPAGDNGAGTDAANFPAAYPGVIAVGGFDQNFVKGSYSSQQSYVALTAAGTGVIAASAHGGYTVVNSTSAASATVSGIAALIRARFPGLSAAQVANALTSSAVFQPIGGSSSGSGSGTADAGRALAAAAAVAAPADQRAGAGAVSGAAPTAPVAAPVASDGLAPRVLRAAIISAGALILLLLFVTAYAATGRRKERKVATDAKASAEWVRSTQNAYSPYGSGEADQMLEYFASPSNGPSSPADPFARIQGAQRAGSGSAGAQFPGAQVPGAPFPGAQVPGAPFPGAQVPESQVAAGAGSDAGASGSTGTVAAASSSAVGGRSVGAWVPLGAGSRAQSRQPPVSGAPPWEPAAEPDSELPWAAVPGPAAAAGRPRPASSAASPASDSIWPTTAPAAPASPPSDQAWANLAASAPSAVSAKPAAPTRSAGDEPAPAGGPSAAAFAPLAPFPSAAPGSAAAPGPADPPASAGTLWQVRTTPRSPSGSDWELPDNEPARQAAAGQDPHRQQADRNAYQQPASAETSWRPSGGGTGWQSAAEQPPAAPAGEAWAAGGAWPAGETRAPGDPQAVGEAGSAGPDESASDAEGAWDAQASGSSPHWLAAAVSERWQPSARSSPWQPSADTETGTGTGTGSAADSPRWGSSAGTPADPPRGSTAGAPATDSLQWGTPPGTPRDSAPWDATPESPRWESASEARRAESPPWQARHAEPAQRDAASESAPRKAASAESRWGPGAADSGWNTTAEAPWQAAGPEPRQDSAAGEDDSAAGGDDLFAWRPSAATETFPAVGDD